MMKCKLPLVLLLFCLQVKGQQRPHYTQYLQNMQVINPALSGMYNSLHIKAGTRNQWVGLESAPKTSYFTISTPINFDSNILTAGSADYGIIEPATKSDRDSYYASDNHHGTGLIVLNDKTGALSRASVNLTYAYHIALGSFANLSVGVGAGVNRISLNTNELRFENPLEPAITESNIIKWSPDVNAGIYLYAAQFYVGASIQQVMKQKLSFNSNYDLSTGEEVPHYFVTFGYRQWIKEDFSVTPSIMFRSVSRLPMGLDVNLKAAFRDNVWIAGSYRKKDSFSAIMGFTISKTFEAGYAYDFTRSQLQTVSNGTHEIVIGLKL